MTEAAHLSRSFADELDDLSLSCQSTGEADLRRPIGLADRTAFAASAEEAPLSRDEAIELLCASNAGIEPDLSQPVYRFVKRAFDLAASGAAIAALFIPALVLCVAICIKSPGASPVYSQIRVGRLRKDGSFRLFRMYKFRSMVPNADQMLDDLRDDNEADGPLFKIRKDPRIIPGIGPFIRRHSIDEGMNLVNVFLGDIPLRILKTRRGFSLKTPGAFALPANEGRTERTVSSQVVGCFYDGLHAPRNFSGNLTAQASHTREIFAKRVFGTVDRPARAGSRVLGFPVAAPFSGARVPVSLFAAEGASA